ncbi:hypothetical protein MUP32_05800 [Candidatus Microgenomates bacterium]|nr:hypothetical protein [Candidatus Microgenomates bacterium]
MSSSRIILVFLGFIFIVIVILSSGRIAVALRSRLGQFFPFMKSTSLTTPPKITPTLTPSAVYKISPTSMPSPTLSAFYGGQNTTKGGQNTTKGGVTTAEIPATGPNDLLWVILGGSTAIGYSLKKLSNFIYRR